MSATPVTDCFIDTNILLYAVSTAPEEAAKARVARQLLETRNWAWSAQVAAEFVRASTSPKQAVPLARVAARRWIETWMVFPMLSVDGALVLSAMTLAERYQVSHFDAQILAAAERLGCETLFSEDLSHGQTYGRVRVVNPFLPAST